MIIYRDVIHGETVISLPFDVKYKVTFSSDDAEGNNKVEFYETLEEAKKVASEYSNAKISEVVNPLDSSVSI